MIIEETNLNIVKMKNTYIFLIGIVLIFLSSCNKSEIDTFAKASSDEFINIIGEDTELSFDLLPETTYDIDIVARLSGFATNSDRKIDIAVSDATTAIEGKHYTLSECIIPADKVEGICKLTLMADTALLEGDSLILELEVQQSGKLLPGVDTKLRYKIVAGLPNDWPDWMYLYFFGSYSKVKYKFLIGLYGSVEAVGAVVTWDNFWHTADYKFYLTKALEEYEKEHGEPLRDENGNVVTAS